MGSNNDNPKLEELLGRAAWARRLARHLVRQRSDADDLLQDAWMVASDKAARGDTPSRPWLAGVLRVLGLSQTRAAGRRRHRESEAAIHHEVAATAAVARPDDLLNQVETQRRLSEALLALPEPYRTTILLRYYEELSAAEIARRTQVPAGTVRWRLQEGLARLRQHLERGDGDRASLALALVKLAHVPTSRIVATKWHWREREFPRLLVRGDGRCSQAALRSRSRAVSTMSTPSAAATSQIRARLAVRYSVAS